MDIEVGELVRFSMSVLEESAFKDMGKMNFSLLDANNETLFERKYSIRTGLYWDFPYFVLK